jgi:hypothetical protein
MTDTKLFDYVSAFQPFLNGEPPAKPSFIDKLMQTWPVRLAEDFLGGVTAPGRAYQSTWDNPITTDQLIKPAVDLAGAAVGTPGGMGGIGSGVRLVNKTSALTKTPPYTNEITRNYLEGITNLYSRGEFTAKQVQKEFKKRGWMINLRTPGGYGFEAYDPSGALHYLEP